MGKLISMTDFVLGNTNKYQCFRYSNFLIQPLTLGMFVPCDSDGNVLEEPNKKDFEAIPFDFEGKNYPYLLKEYQEAKDRVLFDGFKLYKEKSGFTKVFNSEYNIELYLPNNNKVERLAFGKIVLTESAKKQIGLTV